MNLGKLNHDFSEAILLDEEHKLNEHWSQCTSKSLVRLEANVYSMKNKTCANIGYAKKLNGYTYIWIYA